MPRLPWILVAIGLCLLATLQPAILAPLAIPGFVLLSALRDFVPSDVLYSTYLGVDLAFGAIVLSSALFWLMLTFVIRWRSRGPFISFLMRFTGMRIGLIAATLNVLVFIALLVTREPAYGRLAELDACFRGGSSCDHSSAEPMYLAGRPFYSSMHVGGVPWTEDAFFAANLPAVLGGLLVEGAVWEAWYWFEAESLSSAQRSWVSACCFMTLAGLWAFLVGAASHRFVRWSGRIAVTSHGAAENEEAALASHNSRMARLPWTLVVVGVCLLAVWRPVILLPLVIPGFLVLQVATFLPSSISMEVHYGFGPDGGPSAASIAFVVLLSAVGWAAVVIPAFWFRRRRRFDPGTEPSGDRPSG